MLTNLEILNITETIDKAEISFSHLRDELIDHVCCEIECQMEQGLNFPQAFENIKSKVGIRELQKVQENTLLLIDKKYRIMKRVMKVSGVLSLIFLIIGTLSRIFHYVGANVSMGLGFLLLCFVFLPSAISLMHKENKTNTKILVYLAAYIGSIGFSLGVYFKLMHWPGASILLCIGLLILSVIFLPMLWFTLKKTIVSKNEKVIVLIGTVAGSLFLLGLLFKMMHWPEATILYLISVLALILVFIPAYTYIKFKLQEYVNEKFIYIIYAFTWILLLSLLIQLNFAFNIDSVFKKDATARLSSIQYYKAKIDNTPGLNNDSLSSEQINFVKERIVEIDVIIESAKAELITIANPDIQYDKNDVAMAVQILRDNHNYEGFHSILFGDKEKSPARLIASKIKEVREYFLQHTRSKDQFAIVSALLNTSIPEDISAKGITWENYQFMNKTPLIQYEVLLRLQQKVNIAAIEMINGLK